MNRSIVVTAIILLLTILFFENFDADIWFQNYLYNINTGQWLLNRDNAIFKLVFYDGIKKVIVLFVLLVAASSLVLRKRGFVIEHKQEIIIFLLSAILVPSIVGLLKTTTNMPCPRDLEYYGGDYPRVKLFSSYPAEFHQEEKIRCYPAGHASGGFVFLSLFFLFKRKRNKVLAVVFSLSLGWLMGGYKMLIGDHFLSHTIVTMLLAWLIILIIAKSVYQISDSRQNI